MKSYTIMLCTILIGFALTDFSLAATPVLAQTHPPLQCPASELYIPSPGLIVVPHGCFCPTCFHDAEHHRAHWDTKYPCPIYNPTGRSPFTNRSLGDYFTSGHRGLDILGEKNPIIDKRTGKVIGGTPVYATHAGTVLKTNRPGVLRLIFDKPVVTAAGTVRSVYMAHMATTYIDHAGKRQMVETIADGIVNQRVPAGRLLGYQGNWGAFQTHLHISYLQNDRGREGDFTQALDPGPFLGMRSRYTQWDEIDFKQITIRAQKWDEQQKWVCVSEDS